MSTYEGIFIVKPELKEEDAKGVFKAINDSITKTGGSVKKEEVWGKRQLAYPIKKAREGYYYKLDFDLEPAGIAKIETAYKLNDNILRTMITKK